MLPPALVILHPHFTLPGGAGKLALELGARLTKHFRVFVVAQQIDAVWSQQYPTLEFISLRGPVTSRWSFWLTWLWWYGQTARQLNHLRKKYTITIFNNVFPAHWFGLLYKKFHPTVKSVWYCHEPSAFIYSAAWRAAIPSVSKRFVAKQLQTIFVFIDRWLVRQADHIFTNSRITMQLITETYKRSSTVVYPGIDPAEYQPIPFENKHNIILSVSRLTTFKRVDVLIDAFARANLPNYRLRIIGEGEARESLQERIKSHNAQDRVEILSAVSNDALKHYFAQAKLMVLCSKHEPFGIVITEALMSGTPVLADASGGPKEIVLDGQTGQLIDCTVEQLTIALQQLLSQPDLLKRYSEQARLLTAKRFSWDTAVSLVLPHL